jgi:hypothetical protein
VKPWDSPAIGKLAPPRAASRPRARVGPSRARCVLATLGLAARTVAGVVVAAFALAPLALRAPPRRAPPLPAGTPAGAGAIPPHAAEAAPPEG